MIKKENDSIVYEKVIPAHGAEYVSFPESMRPEIGDYLRSQGISRLYSHQAEMFVRAGEGESLVITTATASRKTLSFLLPVLQKILENPLMRAIFIYPTKALASDQYRVLAPVLEYFGEGRISAGVYDGDTMPAENMLANPSIAEDGVQQIFERILLHPDTALHVPEHEIIYYLFAIQRNVMYTLTTDEYKNSHYPLDYDDGNDISRNLIDPEDLFIRYIYLDSLKIIFSTLTPDFRDTIIFHYFYGFKYSEIACMFHISERAVKKRIAVAKKRVRTMFQKEDFL